MEIVLDEEQLGIFPYQAIPDKYTGTVYLSKAQERHWYVNGKHHREDGPAIFSYREPFEEWYLDGVRHRDDGPAARIDDCYEWYRDGNLHREDGPAVVDLVNGSEAWYINGWRHRVGAPALITKKFKKWYLNGLLHRTDGPAIVYSNGVLRFWENGKEVSDEYIFNKLTEEQKIRVIWGLDEWHINNSLKK